MNRYRIDQAYHLNKTVPSSATTRPYACSPFRLPRSVGSGLPPHSALANHPGSTPTRRTDTWRPTGEPEMVIVLVRLIPGKLGAIVQAEAPIGPRIQVEAQVVTRLPHPRLGRRQQRVRRGIETGDDGTCSGENRDLSLPPPGAGPPARPAAARRSKSRATGPAAGRPAACG